MFKKELIVNVVSMAGGQAFQQVTGTSPLVGLLLFQGGRIGYSKGKNFVGAMKGEWNVGVGQTKLHYKHNPSDSPKVLLDALEDENAVYGYKPNDTGSLKKFVKYDWTNSEVVAKFRNNRLLYHIENDGYKQLVNSMRADGYSDVEIAKTLVEKRNANRLSSYINENGKISDIEIYNQAKEHCISYEELKYGINGKPGKSDLQIIESAMRGNQGMDACCGLYDDYYATYK